MARMVESGRRGLQRAGRLDRGHLQQLSRQGLAGGGLGRVHRFPCRHVAREHIPAPTRALCSRCRPVGRRVVENAGLQTVPRSGLRGHRSDRSITACLKERGRVNTHEALLCSEGRLERRQRDLYAGARGRGRSGSRWSARSDARTNDLEAAASRHADWFRLSMATGVGFDHPGSRLGARSFFEHARWLRHVFAEIDRHDGLRPRPGRLNHLAGFATPKGGSLAEQRARTRSGAERHAASWSARQRISPSRKP